MKYFVDVSANLSVAFTGLLANLKKNTFSDFPSGFVVWPGFTSLGTCSAIDAVFWMKWLLVIFSFDLNTFNI